MNNNSISSKGKKILVVSDMHQEVAKMNNILAKEDYDIMVNLGDEFDSFDYDSNDDVIKACKFIENNIFKENFYFLFGNHDLHYLFDNKYTSCSGYESRKSSLIKDYFSKIIGKVRNKFKWYIWIDNYLCTHAGIHINHIPSNTKLTKLGISKWLDEQSKIANVKLLSGESHWFYRAGFGRGGNMPVGGITWMDYFTEFIPITKVKQIVGHSNHKTIVGDNYKDISKSHNLDIDCFLNQYLIIQNGKIKIKNYIEL